jgi:hypothetical protein
MIGVSYILVSQYQIAESVTEDESSVTDVFQHARSVQRRTFSALDMV